jgi:hypothetical protein
MTNAWALRPLPIAGVTPLYGIGSAPGHEPMHVANDHMGVIWKSGQAQYINFQIDLGSPQEFDAVLFFGCTGSTASWVVDVWGSNSPDPDTATSLSPTMPFLAGSVMPTHGRGVGYWERSSAQPAYRYLRVRVITASEADAVAIGRIAIGTKLTLERNFAFGAGFGVRDLGKVNWSHHGVMLRRRGAKLRTVGLTFPAAKKDEVEQKIQPLLELVAGQEPIVLCTDPDTDPQRQNRLYFGHLVGELGTVWARASGFEWRANLVDLVPIPKAVT